MKKKSFMTMLLVIIMVLTGCGNTDEGKESSTEDVVIQPSSIEPETTPEPTPEATPEPTEEDLYILNREVVDGKMQSYLTGEWKDEKVAKRRSMAVMMPNNKPALPQYGISAASIIYEAPVEGRVTRLMTFVEDYDDLEYIGPVRSSRDYYVYEAMAYDAIYVNWGLARPFVEELLKSDRIDNISQAVAGIYNAVPGAFTRLKRPGYATEFTGYMLIDGYTKGVQKLKYETEYRDTFEQAFTFANDGYPATYEDKKDATLVIPGGKEKNRGGYSNSECYFEYNKEDGLYYRYQYGGPHIDEMNGEQLTCSNIVFKICHGEVHEPTDKDYLAFGVHGTGEAYVFTAGKVIKGTWERTSDNAANMFYDENGNEIIFNQGKTWICNIWKEYSEHIYFE